MAVRSRYEGPDLEALLDQVRTELGSGTKIVSANKIRSGGVAGFFAREKYEVIVEHDGSALITAPAIDLTDPQESVRPRDLAPSILDLVDQVSAQERAAAPRISTEGEPFAAVMDRMARNAGMPTPPAPEISDADDDDEEIDDAEIAVVAPAAPVAPAPAPAPQPLPQPPVHVPAQQLPPPSRPRR